MPQSTSIEWGSVEDSSDPNEDWCLSFGESPSPASKVIPFVLTGIPLHRGIKVVRQTGGTLVGWPSLGFFGSATGQHSGRHFGAWPRVARVLSHSAEEIDELAIYSATDLAELLTAVNRLGFAVEEDDFGKVRPSYDALKHCFKLLLDLVAQGKLVKPSDITTDRDGSIRISWMKADREAELICPSIEGELPYVYYSSNDEYGTDVLPNTDLLALRIAWAIKG